MITQADFCSLIFSASSIYKEDSSVHLIEEPLISHSHRSNMNRVRRRRACGGIVDADNLQMLEDKRDIFYPLSFMLHNTKPVGHQVFLIQTNEIYILYIVMSLCAGFTSLILNMFLL